MALVEPDRYFPGPVSSQVCESLSARRSDDKRERPQERTGFCHEHGDSRTAPLTLLGRKKIVGFGSMDSQANLGVRDDAVTRAELVHAGHADDYSEDREQAPQPHPATFECGAESKELEQV